MTIVLDQETHEYTVDGRKLPGVTRVLEPIVDFSRIPPDVLQRAQDEGKAVHSMVEFYEEGSLDERALPDWLRPRLDAWVKFKAQTGWITVFSEHRVADRALGYAGTLDLYGRAALTGVTRPALIDVKRTTKLAAGVQTAAYLNALVASGDISRAEAAITDRFALNLKPDGTWKLEGFSDPDDWRCFVGLLAVHKWKEKNPCWSR